jgi:hypothetical protein
MHKCDTCDNNNADHFSDHCPQLNVRAARFPQGQLFCMQSSPSFGSMQFGVPIGVQMHVPMFTPVQQVFVVRNQNSHYNGYNGGSGSRCRVNQCWDIN